MFLFIFLFFFFFFQAEDGIRDPLVTGVQTCALPISPLGAQRPGESAPEETETPLGGRSGRFRKAPGSGPSRGAERRIVPRRQQTLLDSNRSCLTADRRILTHDFVEHLHVYTFTLTIQEITHVTAHCQALQKPAGPRRSGARHSYRRRHGSRFHGRRSTAGEGTAHRYDYRSLRPAIRTARWQGDQANRRCAGVSETGVTGDDRLPCRSC